jgi:hypothetical protein
MTKPAEGEPEGTAATHPDERRVADDTERERTRRHQDDAPQPDDDPRGERDDPQPFSGSDH